MRTQIALFVIAMTGVIAFGLFLSDLASAEQSATGPLASSSVTADGGAFALILTGGGHGGGHGGGWHGGGWHQDGYRHHGRHGGYSYPWWYGDRGSYNYGTKVCLWNGYKYKCYNNSEDIF